MEDNLCLKQKFLNKALKTHNKKYDYSLVEYKNNKTKVKITCSTHGVFEQTPGNHINKKSGCPSCVKLKKYTTQEFINKAKKIHEEKYDYSLVNYVNSRTKIKIICPKHGVFKQSPAIHLYGIGCLDCSGKNKRTVEEFVKEAKKIHGEKYDYSLVEYNNGDSKVKIICPTHGVFKQTPRNHLHNQQCPICNISKGELFIKNFLEENKITYKQQYSFPTCKYKYILRFDFYLPDHNLCIEYDGIQHFKPVDYFGGVKALNESKKRDEIKNNFCENNNIKLIRINHNQKDLNQVFNDLKMEID